LKTVCSRAFVEAAIAKARAKANLAAQMGGWRNQGWLQRP